MQNSVFLALWKLIFALKTKIAPPKGNWDENLRWCGVEKEGLSVHEDLFFYLEITCIWTEKPSQIRWKPFCFWDHLNLDRKTVSISVKIFFCLGDPLNLLGKTTSIWVETNQNLGQDCLILRLASKTAAPNPNSWLRYCCRQWKAFVLFVFIFISLSCNAFFHRVYRGSTSFQLSPTSRRSSAYNISFTTRFLMSVVTSSITNANRRGLSINPRWISTFIWNGFNLVHYTFTDVSIIVYIYFFFQQLSSSQRPPNYPSWNTIKSFLKIHKYHI